MHACINVFHACGRKSISNTVFFLRNSSEALVAAIFHLLASVRSATIGNCIQLFRIRRSVAIIVGILADVSRVCDCPRHARHLSLCVLQQQVVILVFTRAWTPTERFLEALAEPSKQ